MDNNGIIDGNYSDVSKTTAQKVIVDMVLPVLDTYGLFISTLCWEKQSACFSFYRVNSHKHCHNDAVSVI